MPELRSTRRKVADRAGGAVGTLRPELAGRDDQNLGAHALTLPLTGIEPRINVDSVEPPVCTRSHT